MPKRLVAWVHAHRGDGTSQAFGPGDQVPDWAARQITNPKAWDGEDEYVGGYEPGNSVPAVSETWVEAGTEFVPPAPSPARPPVKGKGSTREAWAGHADALGVTYLREASRDEIIAAIDTR